MAVDYFMPSEVARLVLGYLKEVNCLNAYKVFREECEDLKEHNKQAARRGRDFTQVNSHTLLSILDKYIDLLKNSSKRGTKRTFKVLVDHDSDNPSHPNITISAITQPEIQHSAQNDIEGHSQKNPHRLKSPVSVPKKRCVGLQTSTDFESEAHGMETVHATGSALQHGDQQEESQILQTRRRLEMDNIRSPFSVPPFSPCTPRPVVAQHYENSVASSHHHDFFDSAPYSVPAYSPCTPQSHTPAHVGHQSYSPHIAQSYSPQAPESDDQADTSQQHVPGSTNTPEQGNVSHPQSVALTDPDNPTSSNIFDTGLNHPSQTMNDFQTPRKRGDATYEQQSQNQVTPAKSIISIQSNFDEDNLKTPRRKRKPPKKKGADSTGSSNNNSNEGQIVNVDTINIPPEFQQLLNNLEFADKLAEKINKAKTKAQGHVEEPQRHQVEPPQTHDIDTNFPTLSRQENTIADDALKDIIDMTRNDPEFDALFNIFHTDKNEFIQREYGAQAAAQGIDLYPIAEQTRYHENLPQPSTSRTRTNIEGSTQDSSKVPRDESSRTSLEAAVASIISDDATQETQQHCLSSLSPRGTHSQLSAVSDQSSRMCTSSSSDSTDKYPLIHAVELPAGAIVIDLPGTGPNRKPGMQLVQVHHPPVTLPDGTVAQGPVQNVQIIGIDSPIKKSKNKHASSKDRAEKEVVPSNVQIIRIDSPVKKKENKRANSKDKAKKESVPSGNTKVVSETEAVTQAPSEHSMEVADEGEPFVRVIKRRQRRKPPPMTTRVLRSKSKPPDNKKGSASQSSPADPMIMSPVLFVSSGKVAIPRCPSSTTPLALAPVRFQMLQQGLSIVPQPSVTGLETIQSGVIHTAAPAGLETRQSGVTDTAAPAGIETRQSGVTHTAAPAGIETRQSGVTHTAAPAGLETRQSDVTHTAAPAGLETRQSGVTHTAAPAGLETSQSGVTHTASPARLETKQSDETHTAAPARLETRKSGVTHTTAPARLETKQSGETHTAAPAGLETSQSGVTHTAAPAGLKTSQSGVTHTAAPAGLDTRQSGVTHTRAPARLKKRRSGVTHTATPAGLETKQSGVTLTAAPAGLETRQSGATHTRLKKRRSGVTHTAAPAGLETQQSGATHTTDQPGLETRQSGVTHNTDLAALETRQSPVTHTTDSQLAGFTYGLSSMPSQDEAVQDNPDAFSIQASEQYQQAVLLHQVQAHDADAPKFPGSEEALSDQTPIQNAAVAEPVEPLPVALPEANGEKTHVNLSAEQAFTQNEEYSITEVMQTPVRPTGVVMGSHVSQSAIQDEQRQSRHASVQPSVTLQSMPLNFDTSPATQSQVKPRQENKAMEESTANGNVSQAVDPRLTASPDIMSMSVNSPADVSTFSASPKYIAPSPLGPDQAPGSQHPYKPHKKLQRAPRRIRPLYMGKTSPMKPHEPESKQGFSRIIHKYEKNPAFYADSPPMSQGHLPQSPAMAEVLNTGEQSAVAGQSLQTGEQLTNTPCQSMKPLPGQVTENGVPVANSTVTRQVNESAYNAYTGEAECGPSHVTRTISGDAVVFETFGVMKQPVHLTAVGQVCGVIEQPANSTAVVEQPVSYPAGDQPVQSQVVRQDDDASSTGFSTHAASPWQAGLQAGSPWQFEQPNSQSSLPTDEPLSQQATSNPTKPADKIIGSHSIPKQSVAMETVALLTPDPAPAQLQDSTIKVNDARARSNNSRPDNTVAHREKTKGRKSGGDAKMKKRSHSQETGSRQIQQQQKNGNHTARCGIAMLLSVALDFAEPTDRSVRAQNSRSRHVSFSEQVTTVSFDKSSTHDMNGVVPPKIQKPIIAENVEHKNGLPSTGQDNKSPPQTRPHQNVQSQIPAGAASRHSKVLAKKHKKSRERKQEKGISKSRSISASPKTNKAPTTEKEKNFRPPEIAKEKIKNIRVEDLLSKLH